MADLLAQRMRAGRVDAQQPVPIAGSMLFGPVEGGLIAQGFGIPAAFTATGFLCLATVAFGARSIRRVLTPAQAAKESCSGQFPCQ